MDGSIEDLIKQIDKTMEQLTDLLAELVNRLSFVSEKLREKMLSVVDGIDWDCLNKILEEVTEADDNPG